MIDEKALDEGYQVVAPSMSYGIYRAAVRAYETAKVADQPDERTPTFEKWGEGWIKRQIKRGEQPVDQPNLLRALIANDVLIRNIRHRDARWHDDPAVQAVLDENTRVIQAGSSERESGDFQMRAYVAARCARILEIYKNDRALQVHTDMKDILKAIGFEETIDRVLAETDEKGRRGSDD